MFRCVTIWVTVLIKNFRHKGVRRFFVTGELSGIQADHAKRLAPLLDMLDAATSPNDLRLPSLRLHRLRGDLMGSWSIRVSGNWRLVFRVEKGDVYDVQYVDYH